MGAAINVALWLLFVHDGTLLERTAVSSAKTLMDDTSQLWQALVEYTDASGHPGAGGWVRVAAMAAFLCGPGACILVHWSRAAVMVWGQFGTKPLRTALRFAIVIAVAEVGAAAIILARGILCPTRKWGTGWRHRTGAAVRTFNDAMLGFGRRLGLSPGELELANNHLDQTHGGAPGSFIGNDERVCLLGVRFDRGSVLALVLATLSLATADYLVLGGPFTAWCASEDRGVLSLGLALLWVLSGHGVAAWLLCKLGIWLMTAVAKLGFFANRVWRDGPDSYRLPRARARHARAGRRPLRGRHAPF